MPTRATARRARGRVALALAARSRTTSTGSAPSGSRARSPSGASRGGNVYGKLKDLDADATISFHGLVVGARAASPSDLKQGDHVVALRQGRLLGQGRHALDAGLRAAARRPRRPARAARAAARPARAPRGCSTRRARSRCRSCPRVHRPHHRQDSRTPRKTCCATPSCAGRRCEFRVVHAAVQGDRAVPEIDRGAQGARCRPRGRRHHHRPRRRRLPEPARLQRRAPACARWPRHPRPLVSAIGHEADRPLLDEVADLRASTPTDAAKRVVPDVAEELARVAAGPRPPRHAAARSSSRHEIDRLEHLRSRPALADAAWIVDRRAEELTRLGRARRRTGRPRARARRRPSRRTARAPARAVAAAHARPRLRDRPAARRRTSLRARRRRRPTGTRLTLAARRRRDRGRSPTGAAATALSAAPNRMERMPTPPRDVAELSFEQARDELVRVVAELEQGVATLEQSLALWERGEALAARCEEWLLGAKARLDAARAAAASASGARRRRPLMAQRPPRVVAELGRPETPEETAARKAENSRIHRASQNTRNLVARARRDPRWSCSSSCSRVPRSDAARSNPIDVAAVAEQAQIAERRPARRARAARGLARERGRDPCERADGVTAWYDRLRHAERRVHRRRPGLRREPDLGRRRSLARTLATGTITIDGIEWDGLRHPRRRATTRQRRATPSRTEAGGTHLRAARHRDRRRVRDAGAALIADHRGAELRGRT